MEFAGKDGDEMFEDIGHSSEARKTMEKYLIGTLKVIIYMHIILYYQFINDEVYADSNRCIYYKFHCKLVAS